MSAQTEHRPHPLRWWDLGVVVLVLVMCVPGGIGALNWASGGGLAASDVVAPLTVLGAFVVLYAVLGRPALRRAAFDEPRIWWDLVFLAGVVFVVGLGAAVSTSFATLQAIVYPMIWVIAGVGASDVARFGARAARRRGRLRAVAWSAVLALIITVGAGVSFLRHDVPNPMLTAAGIGGASFTFAVILGMWITSIYEQGERHRELAEQLRLAQAEVAELSVARGAATERERLSRELHDTLTQTLAGLVMLSEQTERALAAGDSARAAERAGRVSAAARESVAEARALVATTQPLGESGLNASLERVAARLEADTGLAVACALEDVPLDREQQVVLLRAAQEGLANARKHARATRVTLTLTGLPGGGALLRVVDNGVGPAHTAAEHDGSAQASPGAAVGGFGLTGLAERARAIGGAVQFGAAEHAGSVLEARLSPRTMEGGRE
ncbi:sensor histidine kinase [Leucobacter chromiireducens]|uniref:histidine kinase n=1 Tax=Leucobacter chromiireducens subsp. chromiireducens TaxID=660067 RepID=A0ABS1SQK4_9MICO|nr:sensor histidine kinase [Leucobacter chromiireducens]MBL3690448.1 sensor histidine kinase [Leucobacter chromiireducens subsp. chromiireducens]